tara:strand:- start:5655 stop:6335 length:681 start_codon:yes stop_codon:yes gene_type:complete
MFAVIKTGGKQYRVSPNDVIKVERRSDAETGKNLELTEVLAVGDDKDFTLGTPNVTGAKVIASVLENTRSDKLIVFKKKRRKNHRRTRGHRQYLTVLRIEEILKAGQKPSAKKKPVTSDQEKQVVSKKTKAKSSSKKKQVKASSKEIDKKEKVSSKSKETKISSKDDIKDKKAKTVKKSDEKKTTKKTPTKVKTDKKQSTQKSPTKKSPTKKSPEKKNSGKSKVKE